MPTPQSAPELSPSTGTDLRAVALHRPVLITLIAIPLLLDVALFAAFLLMKATQGTPIDGITLDILRGFEFSNESNIPTWISSLYWAAFGVAGLLLALLATSHRWSFALLGAVGLFASLDEIAEIHERLEPVGAAIVPKGADLGVSWVIPGALLALAVGLLLLRMVLRLPRRARAGIMIGGAVFLIGALGVELIWAMVMGVNSDQFSLVFILFNIAEENLEMMGLGIATAGLASLARLSHSDDTVRLEVDRELTTA